MKTNLTALLRRATRPLILLGFLLLGLVLFSGCALAPSSAEKFAFDISTNTVPVATNWTTSVSTTNPGGVVETKNLVTWETNIETRITYTVNTNGLATIGTAAAITDIFAPGWGQVAGAALFGFVGLWARSRSTAKTMTTSASVLTQSVEMLLAIIETNKGKAFTDQIKLKLAKDQNTAGVLREISMLVTQTVDNDQAKAIARQLLATLPAQSPAT